MADTISPHCHQYALVTDELTNEQTEGHCHSITPSLYGSGLMVLSFVDDHNVDGIEPNDDESREKVSNFTRF